ARASFRAHNRRRIYTRPGPDDIDSWIGIGVGTHGHPDSLVVWASVGVHFHRVEELLRELVGGPIPPFVATHGISLRSLSPSIEEAEWHVRDANDVVPKMAELADRVLQHAVPQIERLLDHAELLAD